MTLFLLCAMAAFAQEVRYDLILKGGHVIDPRNSVDKVADVGIRGEKVGLCLRSLLHRDRDYDHLEDIPG